MSRQAEERSEPWRPAYERRDQVIEECLAKPGVVECYPFGEAVAVFKVAGRMFALVTLDASPAKATVKCDPDLAIALRERYAAITPGYHSSKRHWNTIVLDGSVSDEEVSELVDHSYQLVLGRLTKTQRRGLAPGP